MCKPVAEAFVIVLAWLNQATADPIRRCLFSPFGFLLNRLDPFPPCRFGHVWGNFFPASFQAGKSSSKSLDLGQPPPHPFSLQISKLKLKKVPQEVWIWFPHPTSESAFYAGLLQAPAEGFGPGFFCPSGKKTAFHAVCAYFRLFLVFSSNPCNFY